MKLRKLAIVGRPNVGKSALFNRICKKRISIVDEQEGVTRDRIYARAEIFGYPFEVIDAGGIDPRNPDIFKQEILRQAQAAIKEADTIVMVVDSRCGVLDLDREIALELLKSGKPITLAINKVDNPGQECLLHDFYSLGITDVFPVSATQGTNIAELLESVWKPCLYPNNLKNWNLDDAKAPGLSDRKRVNINNIDPLAIAQSRELSRSSKSNASDCLGIGEEAVQEEESSGKICIVGRTNVGKSTFLNALLKERRCLVSPEAGTTRDSLDIPFSFNEKNYLLIDTAGIRRKKSEKDVVEKFAAIRTKEAIERSHICLLMIDATTGMSTQDKRIAREIEKSGKGCIVLLNKWDLVKGYRMEACLKGIRLESPFLGHCPVLFISAKTGRNLELVFPEIEKVYEAWKQKLSTHQLNTFVERAIQLNHPPALNGKRLRVYYLTQVTHSPPRFILFVNNPALMTATYKKYLLNQLRVHYNFLGTPLQFILRGKKKSAKI